MSKNKLTVDDSPPKITIVDDELSNAGYIGSGIQRYKQTVISYAEELFKNATLLGEIDKVDELPRDVTGEHVRKATVELNKSASKNEIPAWVVLSQIGEYICTAAVGVGASNVSENWGIITFGIGIVIGIALFVNRMTNQKRKS